MSPKTGRLRQAAKQFERASLARVRAAFAPWLALPEAFGAPPRERLFPPATTFWLFLAQVLSADGSCREAVRGFLAELFYGEHKTASPNTAAYCKARARLKTKQIKSVAREVANRVEAQDEPWLWKHRRVRVADGTGVSMPDTPDNQRVWPQSRRGKPGCSFPVMRLVGLFSLATGALIDIAYGALTVHETTLMRTLWPLLAPGEVLLADRGFCSFSEWFLLGQKGVDCVMRKNARRKNSPLLKRLGRDDAIVQWRRVKVNPKWLDPQTLSELPETMAVREVKVNVDVPGFRTQTVWVATTLLDHRKYTASDLAELYRRRWRVEICFRDIKIAMGMDVLRCQSPAMVEKELWMRVIAYNLIRSLMVEAAREHGEDPERLSFKGTVATLRQWAPLLAQTNVEGAQRKRIYQALLQYIAQDKVPHRPNRVEPRARKRRPKNYQLLNQPRREFREIMHRNKYKKA
jgi:hypothetical protein